MKSVVGQRLFSELISWMVASLKVQLYVSRRIFKDTSVLAAIEHEPQFLYAQILLGNKLGVSA